MHEAAVLNTVRQVDPLYAVYQEGQTSAGGGGAIINLVSLHSLGKGFVSSRLFAGKNR